MRRAERLEAPRVWLPRGSRRGWVRAVCVATLVAAAVAVLLLPDVDADQGTVRATPTVSAAAGDRRAVAACRSREFVPPHGAVGFPLRLPDPAVLAVIRAGQHVDVLVRPDGDTGTADVVAADLAVLCGVGAAGEPDGVLYLAVSPAQAAALAAIGPGARLSVTVRSP
ncbi:hypothetical protein [Cryptosporangium sp. NPDC048952]|uniref:hypothetical protein n=1 Tax=Cryptosporangium sp. NPDC048952 TaxID=3363961 RepID=UPI0037114DE6